MIEDGYRKDYICIVKTRVKMSHSHDHHHHHHHEHEVSLDSLNGVYVISIILNFGFVIIEAIIGILHNSLGLLSDAGHNLSDVFSLMLAMIAFKLGQSIAHKGYTYGYRKSSVLISLLNAIILLVAVGAILLESINKFISPAEVDGAAISWTAGIGIVVNGFTAYLLMRKQGHDINTRGAYLHMLADTLVSAGVVISGLVITFTGWNIIDPIVSLMIAAVILISTWDLLKESIRMSIDAVPENVDIDEIKELIEQVEGVNEVHHIHIWPISTTETALTAHIKVRDISRAEDTIHAIKHELAEHGISHATLEPESAGHSCDEQECF